MKRAIPQIMGAGHKISRRDHYQILSSALFLLIGVIILVRSLHGGIVIMALLVGGGFLALGAYRLRFVIKYLKERRKCKPK